VYRAILLRLIDVDIQVAHGYAQKPTGQNPIILPIKDLNECSEPIHSTKYPLGKEWILAARDTIAGCK
jgi:hypothetical protein